MEVFIKNVGKNSSFGSFRGANINALSVRILLAVLEFQDVRSELS